jgi:polar amino acid transport system substrate-binding protein
MTVPGIIARACGDMGRRRVRTKVLIALLTTACGLPRDADGTLTRVKGGVLRVGVSENTPWTTLTNGVPGGTEVQLVTALARDIGARASWRVGAESILLASLEKGELDLVIGGLTTASPWAGRVALTQPYEGGRSPSHVMATAPGENAWLVHVEKNLKARRSVEGEH